MGKLLIANWKMNPKKESEALTLARASDASHVVICPPFPFIATAGKALKKAKLGSQDLFYEASGPYTGEVSSEELKSMGVSYVILGHSDRRRLFGEIDEIIAKKVSAALLNGITPILCVGETFADRETNQTFAVLDRQLKMVLSQLPAGTKEELIICYEPVWAISTNLKEGMEPPTAENIAQVVEYLKSIVGNSGVSVSFIYGGSVNSTDLKSYLDIPGISGALVGAASLKPVEFKKMIKIAK
jgi:triosephosphate isomerase (TIM)